MGAKCRFEEVNMTVLRLENLVKSYRQRRVVDGVSLRAESGSVVGLLGPNGAGKTTSFYMAVGMVKPDEGSIFIDDVDITQMPMYLRARQGLGYLPQEPSVFRKLTVHDNVMAILELLPLPREEQTRRTQAILEELGIAHLADQKAAVLSGGERRRLEIARALSTYPSFILLDEPFAGIDPLAIADIKKIVLHLKNLGIGIIVSDHNVRETLEVCDRAYILAEGKVIEEGSPDKIAAAENVRRIYLGEKFRL